MEYCPTELMIAYFYTKLLRGKLFRLFQNLILNLHEEGIRNMTNLEKLKKMETKTGSTYHAISVKSAQEFAVVNHKVGSLNMVNRDVGSDNVRHTVDTRDIVLRMKPDLLSQLRSVAAGAA